MSANRSYKPIATQSPARVTRNSAPVTQYKPISTNFVKTEMLTPQKAPVVQVAPAAVAPVPAPTPAPVVPAATVVTVGGTDEPMTVEERTKTVNFQARNKVSAKVRRQRANRRLRKLLCPKTAVIALHELFHKEPGSSDIDIKVSDQPVKSLFTATADYLGTTFTGYGQSKQAARNNVAEKLLRDMVIEKMRKHPRKEESTVKSEDGDVEMENNTDEDEVPMTHLASFALHKLFSEWAEQGFDVPDFRGPVPSDSAAKNGGTVAIAAITSADKPMQITPEKKLPAPRDTLPANAATLHPAMLLQQMRPGTLYQDLGSQGTVPNTIHCVGVTVNGKQFIGNGKSKKIARKEAARFACQDSWGVTFNPDVLNGSNA